MASHLTVRGIGLCKCDIDKWRVEQSPRAMKASTGTYLDVRLHDILGLHSRLVRVAVNDRSWKPYKIAHDDLAVTPRRTSLGWASPSTSIAGGLSVLLDTTSRGGRGRSSAGGRPTGVATTASGATLSGGDLVKRLVELARHGDGVGANSADR